MFYFVAMVWQRACMLSKAIAPMIVSDRQLFLTEQAHVAQKAAQANGMAST